MKPDLDEWVPKPSLRIKQSRPSHASADELWEAACRLPLARTGRLGRMVRWRIPGLPRELSVEELFSEPPFMVLDQGERTLVSGLVGRIWTLRRDYPSLDSVEEFRDWDQGGTARVVFAHWVQERPEGGSSLSTEARVQPFGHRGRVGVAAVRPLVRAFSPLVGSEGIRAAVRIAEER